MPFIDTTIVVYAFSDDARSDKAQALLAASPVISAQVLNEFANIGRKTLAMSWPEIREAVGSILILASAVVALDDDLTIAALDLADRYRFSFHDALIVAAALRAGCDQLYSEGMQAGLIVEKQLTSVNPFL